MSATGPPHSPPSGDPSHSPPFGDPSHSPPFGDPSHSPPSGGTPAFSVQDAVALTRELYSLEVTAEELPSYLDRNFRLEHASGRRLVLKIANAAGTRDGLDLQNRAMEHVAATNRELVVPRLLSTLDGERIATVDGDGGHRHHVRLVTYLDGIPWAAAPAPTPDRLRQLGRFVAALTQALEDFSHPAMHRSLEWDVKRLPMLRGYLDELADPRRRRIVTRVLDRFDRRLVPLLEWLPASVIHNDANDYNVLVDDGGERIVGLIDFGEVVHTATVAEVAITMAYAMLGHDDPISVAGHILRGFHQQRPLGAAELDVVFDLVLARLATSVTFAAYHSRLSPDNAYARVTEAPGWKLLEALIELDPAAVRRRFGEACGEASGGEASGATAGRGIEEILDLRKRHLGPSLSISYRKPLKIVRGAGPYLFDARGRAFLDSVNNVNHVGHCHPRVVAAAAAQNAVLNTNTRYLHDLLVEYAERLTATLPDPLEVCYLVNSGSEANDLALRLARTCTGRRDAVVTGGAYHGTTICVGELSPYKFDGPGGSGRPPHVHQVPAPDVYRGPYKASDPDAGRKFAADVEQAIERAGSDGRQIAAFFCESMISCGGQVIPPAGYLRAAYRHVRDAGGICVADEVQVGFGRPGSAFWAFETQDAVPDVVTLGKPIGNGHPLSAVVTTRELADAFANGMEYFNTFGGNPVSCAVGLAVLDVIEDEGLQDSARVVGDHLLNRLRELATRHQLIGDVRGCGLFLGIELVRDRETLEPAAEEATATIEAMRDRGVLLTTEGPFHNVLKIKPPMVWTTAHADIFVEVLDEVLAEGVGRAANRPYG